MKLQATAFSMLIAGLFITINSKAQDKEKLAIALTNPGKPFVLNLQLLQGSVHVVSYTGQSIEIEAEPVDDHPVPRRNINQNTNTNTNINSTIDISSLEHAPVLESRVDGRHLKVIESGNSITINPMVPKQKLSVQIRVPKQTAIYHLTSLLHADITMDRITGELDISNNAGEILLTNISGSAVVSNVAGGITASFTNIPENTPMAFSTLVGVIDVSFPSTMKANLKVNSDNGILFSDFDLDFSASPKTPGIIRTKDGQYRVDIASNLSPRIGGGGIDIRLKNMEGSIYIRKRKLSLL